MPTYFRDEFNRGPGNLETLPVAEVGGSWFRVGSVATGGGPQYPLLGTRLKILAPNNDASHPISDGTQVGVWKTRWRGLRWEGYSLDNVTVGIRYYKTNGDLVWFDVTPTTFTAYAFPGGSSQQTFPSVEKDVDYDLVISWDQVAGSVTMDLTKTSTGTTVTRTAGVTSSFNGLLDKAALVGNSSNGATERYVVIDSHEAAFTDFDPPLEDPYPWIAGLGPTSASDITARRRFTP